MKKKEYKKRIENLEKRIAEQDDLILKLFAELSEKYSKNNIECPSSPTGKHQYPIQENSSGGNFCSHCGKYHQNIYYGIYQTTSNKSINK